MVIFFVCVLFGYMVKIVGFELEILKVSVFVCLLNVWVLLKLGSSDFL